MNKQPLWTVGTITSIASAFVAVLVAFGVPLSADQRTTVLGLVAVLAPLAVAAIARRAVYAPATVERIRTEERAAASTE